MRSLCSEFPCDNPTLHYGGTWVSLRTTGALAFEAPLEAPPERHEEALPEMGGPPAPLESGFFASAEVVHEEIVTEAAHEIDETTAELTLPPACEEMAHEEAVQAESSCELDAFYMLVHEVTEKFGGQVWSGSVLRLAMLRTHYRQPIDFTSKALEEARRKLDQWMRAARLALGGEPAAQAPSEDVVAALSDDLNTHAALTSLDRLFNTTGAEQADAHRQLAADLVFLGLASRSELKKPHAEFVSVDAGKVQALIDARLAARAAKNWAESDRIRDELVAMGVTLKDNKDGTTTWEVKR